MKPIFAIYPNERGFGYACVEMPGTLVDSGIVTVRPVCNGKIIKRIGKQMDFYRPCLVILRDGKSLTFRAKRIAALIEEISQVAKAKSLPLHAYSREQIRLTFQQFGAETKYEISQKILEGFGELQPLAPAPRKKWESENYNMGIFDAISLALTHEYLKD